MGCTDTGDGSNRGSLFSCAMIAQIYKPYAELNETQKMYQTIDMLHELKGSFGNIDKRFLLKKEHWLSYYDNLKVWYGALFKGRHSAADIELYVNGTINMDQNVLLTLLSKERETLAKIGITKPQDFQKLKDYIKWAVVGAVYNGLANNKAYYDAPRGAKRGRNVLNHQYISSIPKLNFRMYGIRED